MGIGVDAPRVREDQAVCTPDTVYRSVLATYRAGGEGIVYSPNYAGMNLSNLDGGARALEAYPMRAEAGQITWDEIHVGAQSIFAAAGMSEVSRPGIRRAVMRIEL